MSHDNYHAEVDALAARLTLVEEVDRLRAKLLEVEAERDALKAEVDRRKARVRAAEEELSEAKDALDEFAPHHTGVGLADSIALLRTRLCQVRAEQRLERVEPWTSLADEEDRCTCPWRGFKRPLLHAPACPAVAEPQVCASCNGHGKTYKCGECGRWDAR